MRLRRLFILPLLPAAVMCFSCPRAEDAQHAAAAAVTPPAPPADPRPAVAPTVAPRRPAPEEHAAAAAPPASPVVVELPAEAADDGADDFVDPEPEPEPPAPDRPAHRLASVARETWVFAEPKWGSRRLGYLRAGATVGRRAKPSGFSSCEDGWYRVEPRGYVCVGATATLDTAHPVVQAASRRPRLDTLPYTYVMSRHPAPPIYARLPSAAERTEAEPDLAHVRGLVAHKKREPEYVEPPPADAVPDMLAGGKPAPALANARRGADALLIERAKLRSGFALLSTFDHDERRYGLTTELGLIPVERTRVIRPSSFSGIRLDEQLTLPVAFIKTKRALRYHPGRNGGLEAGAALEWRQAVPLGEGTHQAQGFTWWQARDGTWIRSDQAVRIERFENEPSWAASGRKWIDVSILKQSLVAYEGTRPVYVTLVSTGADGLGDPKETHSTIQGAFLIHTKHVTTTMDGDDVGDEFDLRDVPFVQYFTEGFALHGAYWHDDFGTPRSHGCINLSPLDAAWLFQWTTPEVPDGWHAALTLRKGTLVHTHP